MLATSLEEELEAIAQLYRDRGDAENNFDELKNQWGWTGYTTRELKRSRVMAGVIALIYNWWGLFTRLAAGGKGEAITTRPLRLYGLARRARHGRQTTLTITSSHAKAGQLRRALEAASGFLKRVAATAEQLGFTEPAATDPELDLSRFPPRQGRRHQPPPCRLPRLPAGSRFIERQIPISATRLRWRQAGRRARRGRRWWGPGSVRR